MKLFISQLFHLVSAVLAASACVAGVWHLWMDKVDGYPWWVYFGIIFGCVASIWTTAEQATRELEKAKEAGNE